jgi:hypothetical protein
MTFTLKSQSHLIFRSTTLQLNSFLVLTDMKPASFTKTLRTISLTALLTVMVGANLQQTAQAQLGIPDEYYMPCSEAYFSDPDIMYSVGEGESPEQIARLEQLRPQFKLLDNETEAINASVTVFSSDLDAPIGYVANQVNGVAIEISPEIEQSIQEEMAYPYSREKVKVLNEKYGQYATFGQQIMLIYSPAQTQRMHEILREYSALAASTLTSEEIQEGRELISSQGACSVNNGFIDMGIGTITITVGQRPDLDARLREDTTGATFFR